MGLNAEIKSVVNWDAPSVDIEDNLRKVIKKMLEHNASALAVKVGDEVAGVVTDMDVMDCISNKEDLDEIKASKFMTACELINDKGVKTPCVQLDESQSVESALGVMATAGVHHLLVAGEKTAGMVSVHDLLKLVVE